MGIVHKYFNRPEQVRKIYREANSIRGIGVPKPKMLVASIFFMFKDGLPPTWGQIAK